MRMKFASAVTGGLVLACMLAVTTSASATIIQVRDAVTGENTSGNPYGVFLAGTSSRIIGTTEGEAPRVIPIGTLDLEMRAVNQPDFQIVDDNDWMPLITYCFEPNTGLAFGVNPSDDVGYPYTIEQLSVNPIVTPTKESYIEALWANAYALSQTGRVEAAAFQMIVWELVVDNDIDLLAGDVTLFTLDAHTNNVYNKAQQWLGNLQSGQWKSTTPLQVLYDRGSQDLLTVVPEPTTVAILMLGAIGLAVGRRSRRAA